MLCRPSDKIRLYSGVDRTSVHHPLQILMSGIHRPFSKCSSEEGELSFRDDVLGREKHWALQGEWDAIEGMDSAGVFEGQGGQANLNNGGSVMLPERMAG